MKVLFLFISKILFSVGLAISKMKVIKVDYQTRESLQERSRGEELRDVA